MNVCCGGRTSRSQLGFDQHRPAQTQGARQGLHQRGRREGTDGSHRPQQPPRSNSADNLDLRHVRAQAAAAAAAQAINPAGLPNPRPMVLTPPLSASMAAQAARQGAMPLGAGAPSDAVGRTTTDISDISDAAPSGSRGSRVQTPRQPRPADAVGAAQPQTVGADMPPAPLPPIRTAASAVQQGPGGQRAQDHSPKQQQTQPAGAPQHQPGPAPTTPSKPQPGAYTSALLGLNRPQRSPTQNSLAAAQPATGPAAAAGVGRGSPAGPSHPGSPAAQRAGAAAPAVGARGRSRVDTTVADGDREKAAPDGLRSAPAGAAAPPPPKQPPAPPPAKFALNSEGDFPQLGAVKTRGRAAPSAAAKEMGASPAGSAAQTPVADSKPTSPSFSAASTPATATAAKGAWAGNSAGLLQSAGNSPAAGWPHR